MMDKNITLESIQNAIKAHEAEMARIEDAILGNYVEDPVSTGKTQCPFGRWIYNENNHLKEILGAQFYNTIDEQHTKWHSEYLVIYNILFKNQKKQGFLSKMMKIKSIDGMELDKVKAYYADLQITTSELLKILGASERRVEAMSESRFK